MGAGVVVVVLQGKSTHSRFLTHLLPFSIQYASVFPSAHCSTPSTSTQHRPFGISPHRVMLELTAVPVMSGVGAGLF